MKIFKFGGASVKDADGVRNVIRVLKIMGHQNTLVIVSAMGKTTNALETVVHDYFNKSNTLQPRILEVKSMHFDIIHSLFGKNKSLEVVTAFNELFESLQSFLKSNKSPDYSYVYDQVVSYGELFSTTILHYFLKDQGYSNHWLDARNCIKTDTYYRDANLVWETTQQSIVNTVDTTKLTVTQGFIGSDANNFTTTLGREGSDYSAAIFAYCLNAESVTIWKDVPGVLNGDPRVFDNTILLNQISYREAIELAFYGASVIHPKTLQPLQRKEIPLFVKSFENPEQTGTAVSKGKTLEPYVPCFILKQNQVLLRLSSLDFSFIVEDNISEIFALLHHYQMRVELIQNSAISFSVCVNNKYNRLEELLKVLRTKFKITVFEHVDLFTIRHFNEKALASLASKSDKILLEQRAQETLQVILDNQN